MIQLPSESTGVFQAEWKLEVNSPTNIPLATAMTPSAKAWRRAAFVVLKRSLATDTCSSDEVTGLIKFQRRDPPNEGLSLLRKPRLEVPRAPEQTRNDRILEELPHRGLGL